jgi:NAD(P)-dependent dehydrogenase (short-subunit alcohol dehydrogenase family)
MIQNPFNLDGYTILITGAGSGIGAATAKAVAQAGAAELILIGRDRAKLERTVADVATVSKAKTHVIAADLSQEADRDRVVAVVGSIGKLDVLVNNAGYFASLPIREASLKHWQQNLDINTVAPFMLVKGLVDLLSKSGRGSVINVSSTLAVKPIPGASAYNASKAALGQLTRTLALELGPEHIRVNAVLPAIVDTPMYRGRYPDEKSYLASVPDVNKLHPIGRMGQPQDIAWAVVFLASQAASWITGVELPVDGGMLAT